MPDAPSGSRPACPIQRRCHWDVAPRSRTSTSRRPRWTWAAPDGRSQGRADGRGGERITDRGRDPVRGGEAQGHPEVAPTEFARLSRADGLPLAAGRLGPARGGKPLGPLGLRPGCGPVRCSRGGRRFRRVQRRPRCPGRAATGQTRHAGGVGRGSMPRTSTADYPSRKLRRQGVGGAHGQGGLAVLPRPGCPETRAIGGPKQLAASARLPDVPILLGPLGRTRPSPAPTTVRVVRVHRPRSGP